MHTNRVKAKVDFKFCIGNIPAMLRTTKPVLPTVQKNYVLRSTKLTVTVEQKRIIFNYVDPMIKG